MTATHTPGPWSEPGTYGATRFELIANSKSVAIVNRIEDARRIVACVNACEGISTEGLGSAGQGGLKHLADATFDKRMADNSVFGELLAALERLITDIESDKLAVDIDYAYAAIAKARGA